MVPSPEPQTIYISSFPCCLGHTKYPSNSCLLCNRGQRSWDCVREAKSFFSRSRRRFTIQRGVCCRASLAQGQAASSCIRWIQWKAFITWDLWSFLPSLWLPGIGTLVLWAAVLKPAERQVESDLFTDLCFCSPVLFQLYDAESFVSPLIFKQYLRYSSQEQNELYSHWWSSGKSTHKSHRLGGNLTWNGKKGRQISPGRGLIRETAGVGAACIACKASEPLGGGGKQSAISSRGL